MLNTWSRCLTAALALGALSACVNEAATTLPLPPLATDAQDPQLALIEHVLAEQFAHHAAVADPPTICVEARPATLTAAQEEALIIRFPRLAPRARCESDVPPPSDGFTGERAVVLQVYGVECASAAQCSAWVAHADSPAIRYTMVYENGSWRFAGERRIVPE